MPASIIPCLRYTDAPAAIESLCRVLGLEKKMVVPGDDGTVVHAELSLGQAMIMLGSAIDTPFGRLTAQPSELGGRETQSPYVVVPDADAVYARAKSAGWSILVDIKDEDYGGRGFTCRDIEGHIWSVGTYDPWAEE
jgi:uncharacterized glyoxalase superfamily protein PhnB